MGQLIYFVPLNIFCLGIVDCNSIQDHLHAYLYSEAEADRGKGGNEVVSLNMKYLSDMGYLDSTTQFELSIIMENFSK